MGHYFINDPNLKSNKKQIKYVIRELNKAAKGEE